MLKNRFFNLTCTAALALVLVFALAFFACGTSGTPSQSQVTLETVPFSKGFNFTEWFDRFAVQENNFNFYTEQDFINIKNLGADVIRVPINLYAATTRPDYTIDGELLRQIDRAVDWAEKYQIYIILDNHPYVYLDEGRTAWDPPHTDTSVTAMLKKTWPQLARHFKDRSEYVLYEVMNEPNNISARDWHRVQGEIINDIRKIDQKHTIVVSGVEWSAVNTLYEMTPYADKNLIYTFHFYDPYLFTFQGILNVPAIPFPYDAGRMPNISNHPRDQINYDARNYPRDGNAQAITRQLDKVAEFARKNNVPVYCGEIGVFIQAPAQDRLRWYQTVCGELDRRNIPRTSWDYYGTAGIFNSPHSNDYNSDLTVDVIRAMGYTPPPQRQKEPLRSGFAIYDDNLNSGCIMRNIGSGEPLSLSDTQAADGQYSIRWRSPKQYGYIEISMGNADLSSLAAQGYCLEFKARAERPVRFDIRFSSYDSSTLLKYWFRNFSVDEKLLTPDGRWQTIRIPLRDIRETGSWDDVSRQWKNEQGGFSWNRVRSLDFQAAQDMTGISIWLDSIRIAAP
jgi:endoglucanase